MPVLLSATALGGGPAGAVTETVGGGTGGVGTWGSGASGPQAAARKPEEAASEATRSEGRRERTGDPIAWPRACSSVSTRRVRRSASSRLRPGCGHLGLVARGGGRGAPVGHGRGSQRSAGAIRGAVAVGGVFG